jgi:hypothetical protein
MPTYLTFNTATAIQYADFTTGTINMNVVVPVNPVAGQDKKWGVYSHAKQAGLYFEITGTTLRAVATATEDGQTTVSDTETITWNTDWEGVEVLFKIKWEAGMAKFFINKTKVATIAFSDTDGLVLANTPMSLYIHNGNADDLLIGYIEATGVLKYI